MKNKFNEKIKNVLIYIGIIGASISAIAYIMITVVLILGFETKMKMEQQLLFSIVGAIDGLLITLMLRTQGISFAKNIENNKIVMGEYYKTINKTKKPKKLHTIKYHVITRLVIDVFTKFATIALTTYMILYIYLEGSADFSLIWLATANIFMFICFGLIALAKAFDFYNEEHIPAIIEITNRLKEGKKNENK